MQYITTAKYFRLILNLPVNIVCSRLLAGYVYGYVQGTEHQGFNSNFHLGPSPTLTTKEAFADVMPWFNTTVGLGTSDDEFENEFKNNNDDDLDTVGWCGVPFGK